MIEIERRFLVDLGVLPQLGLDPAGGAVLRQGYLTADPDRVVRVRVEPGAGKAWLTLKGRPSGGAALEIEAAIPMAEGEAALGLALGLVAKRRYRIPAGDLIVELDLFEGAHAGLAIAEIELPRIDHPIPSLAWLGREITDDPRYSNQRLAFDGLPPE